jgi:hypothetical protein
MFCIFANVNDKMTANMATDKTAYWLDIANEDLEVAEDLFKTKRWLYVAFMCHHKSSRRRSRHTGALCAMTSRPMSITTVGWLRVADFTRR